MASIRKEILLESSAENVWAAVRDVGGLHHRLVPGFVVDTRLEEGARGGTFGNGMGVRDLSDDVADDARQAAWSSRCRRLTDHNRSGEVIACGPRRRRVGW